jgi:hypothetical protein
MVKPQQLLHSFFCTLKIPKIDDCDDSLSQDMEKAGVKSWQFEAPLRFSEKQLKILLPTLSLGDRIIIRACAESEYGKQLLAELLERTVIELQSASYVMSAKLLCTLVDPWGVEQLSPEYVQRMKANALKLREQGIRRLPVLMKVALMENGEDTLTSCGFLAADITAIIACARSEFGELVLASWKRRINAQIKAWHLEEYATDSDSESDSNSESDFELQCNGEEASARGKRAANELEGTGSSKRHRGSSDNDLSDHN